MPLILRPNMSGLAASRLPNPNSLIFCHSFFFFVGRGRYDFPVALDQRLEFTLPPDMSILIPKLIYIICLHTYLLDSLSCTPKIICNDITHSMAWNKIILQNTCLTDYCQSQEPWSIWTMNKVTLHFKCTTKWYAEFM